MEELMWWGYLHKVGDICLKRYFDSTGIELATKSPFVRVVFGPFVAESHSEATDKLKECVAEYCREHNL
jgi:hypothetical protein